MVNVSARHRLGFSLIELIVVIAIIAILAGMLMSALQKVREEGRRIICMNNEMQIGKAIYFYANDYDGYLPAVYDVIRRCTEPTSDLWHELLLPYLPSEEIYKCPSAAGLFQAPCLPDESILDYNGYADSGYVELYGMNIEMFWDNELKIEQVPRPSEKIIIGEIQHRGPQIYHFSTWIGEEEFLGDSPEPTTETGRHPNAYRHNDGANFLFVDGHVEWWPRLGKDWKDPDIEGAYNKHWDLTHP